MVPLLTLSFLAVLVLYGTCVSLCTLTLGEGAKKTLIVIYREQSVPSVFWCHFVVQTRFVLIAEEDLFL